MVSLTRMLNYCYYLTHTRVKPYFRRTNPYHLPLREMLIPKKVQMPRDMVREATTVMNAVNPRPYFDFTRSILPVGAEKNNHSTYVHVPASFLRFTTQKQAATILNESKVQFTD